MPPKTPKGMHGVSKAVTSPQVMVAFVTQGAVTNMHISSGSNATPHSNFAIAAIFSVNFYFFCFWVCAEKHLFIYGVYIE